MKTFTRIICFCLLGTSLHASNLHWSITLTNTGSSPYSIPDNVYFIHWGDVGGGEGNVVAYSSSGSYIASHSTTTLTIGYNGWYGSSGHSMTYTAYDCNGNILQTSGVTSTGANDYNFNVGFYIAGCPLLTNTPPCFTNLTWNIQNHDQYGHTYGLSTGQKSLQGNLIVGYGVSGGGNTAIYLRSGQTGSLMANVPCTNASNWSVYVLTGDASFHSDTNTGTSWQEWSTAQKTDAKPVTAGGGSYTGTADTLPSGSVYDGSAVSGTNSNILWQPSTTNNVSLAVMQGSSALYDATTKGFAQNHADLQSLLGAFGSLTNSGNGGTGGNGTNIYSLSLTNYALETTAQAQYDLFTNAQVEGSIYTNTPDYYKSQAADYNTGSNLLAGLTGPTVDPLTADQTHVGDASGLSAWTVSVPYLGVGTIDINPMHYPYFVDISSWCRAFIKWAVLMGILYANSKSLLAAINAAGTWRQSTASGQAVFGVNANLITALAMAVAVSAVMLAIPYFASSKLTSYLSQLSVNPFSTMSGAMGVAIYLADQFFPLALIVAAPVAIFGFQMSLEAQVWGVQTIVRFLVG